MTTEHVKTCDGTEEQSLSPDFELNPLFSDMLTDPDTNQPVPVITVEKIIAYTDSTGCTPQKAKRFLAALCSQAVHGNEQTIRDCLFPAPWLPWKILKAGTQNLHGIRADYAQELLDYLTSETSGFPGFRIEESVGDDAINHFRQIVENLYVAVVEG